MPEPTTTFAASAAGALSALSLALFGVDYYALLWGFIGALSALSRAQAMSRLSATLFVALSTFAGAAIGSGVVLLMGNEQRALLIFACLVGGAGAQFIVGRAIEAVGGVFDRFGGTKP